MRYLHSLMVVLLLAGLARAEDWPQWLGLRRDASTTETIKPWKGPLKIAWKQPVGEGNSSPVVAGGKVYLHYKKQGAFEEVLEAFSAADGKPLWQVSQPRSDDAFLFGNGPRATPAVAGDRIYTFGITGILTCYQLDKQKLLWQWDTRKVLQAPKLFFGASCSPLVEGDAVLMNIGARGASIVAFHKGHGKILWQKLDDPASYASGAILGQGADRQAVFLTGENVVALSPQDGTLLWKYPYKDKANESSSTPIKVGDLVVASAITRGSVGLKPDPKAQPPAINKVWHNPTLTCYFSTPVAVGEHIYLVTGTPPKKPLQIFGEAVLRCVEAKTGKELWKGPKVGTFHASLIRTADNKLLLLEELGDLVLVEPDAKGYKELARAKICGSTWSHAAISDGRLYVRDGKELIAVELPR